MFAFIDRTAVYVYAWLRSFACFAESLIVGCLADSSGAAGHDIRDNFDNENSLWSTSYKVNCDKTVYRPIPITFIVSNWNAVGLSELIGWKWLKICDIDTYSQLAGHNNQNKKQKNLTVLDNS